MRIFSALLKAFRNLSNKFYNQTAASNVSSIGNNSSLKLVTFAKKTDVR